MEQREVVIVAYGRSPACRARKGGLADMHPIEYGAQVLNGVMARVPQLSPADVEDVIMGCAMQFRETAMNVSQLIVNRAGWPDSVSGMTINRFCSGGLQAIALAHNAIACGQGDVMVAGGVESMTLTFNVWPSLNGEAEDKWLSVNYPGAYMSMGQTAENVAMDYNISRVEMEEMALNSHIKAAKARKEGKLAPSIIPIKKTNSDGTPICDENGNQIIVTEDDGILADKDGNLKTSMEKMAGMKPAFSDDGLVTAATSSQTTDCCAVVVLMAADKAKEMGITPICKLKSFAVAGCDATRMGLGPIFATPKAMERAGLTMADMSVIEINEAFASQSLVCKRTLGMPEEITNPYGGAMALGHPLGCTGAILVGKVIDYLRDTYKGDVAGKYGLVTMCIGGGMGAAGILEML